MNALNAFLTTIGDLLFAVFGDAAPWIALMVISIVSGVLMTVVFKHTSNQAALRRTADATKARLLRMKLFRDEPRVAMQSQASMLKFIGLRLWHSVPPMLVLIGPFVLLLSQMALRYEHRPLGIGESAVVALELEPAAWLAHKNVDIEPPIGVVVETPALRDEDASTIYWRVRADAPTSDPLEWAMSGRRVAKSFVSRDDTTPLCKVDPRRAGASWWDRLLHPGEPGFASDSFVTGINVHYPFRSTPILDVDIPWWGTFLIVSMLTALVVRPFLKVQF